MFLIKSFTFNPVQENTYLLYNETKDCIIIDPGCYFDEERDSLLDFFQKQQLNPKLLLNTHCHLDHVFGNKFIADHFGLTLHAHLLEKEMLELAPASGLIYDLPFDNYQGAIIWLKEGDTITLGDDILDIIHVPGHSPGSVCFYCKQQKLLIGGDVLFLNSIGRTDLPGGNMNDLLINIKSKLFVLPDDIIVYPGHGPSTTIGEEKRNNPFLQ